MKKLTRIIVVYLITMMKSPISMVNPKIIVQTLPHNRRPIIALLSLFFLLFVSAKPAHAVIPQLLGPLTALLSIVPQILAFVGVALITGLVFARDTTKMLFYRFRDFVTAHKVTASILSVIFLVGFGWGSYTLVRMTVSPMTSSPETMVRRTGIGNRKANTSWSTFRGGKSRTGHLDTLAGPTTGTPAWVFKDEEPMAVDFSSSPAVVGNRLYIGSAHGSIFSLGGATYCIDTESQKILWRHTSPTPIFSSPAVAGGRVYIGEGYHHDSDCHLRCLDARTGEQIWSFPTTSHVESTPFIHQGKLYFTAGADGVYCIDALEGEQIWHYPAVHADMSPVMHKDKVYFGTGYGDYRIYAVDAQTGAEVWSKQMPYSVWGSPSAEENRVFFGLGRGNFSESAPIPAGKVVALDTETGDILWEHEAEDAVLTAIAIQNGYVTFGSRDGYVYSLQSTDGKLNWKTDLGGPVVSSPAVTMDTIYAATKDGYIYALATDNGKVQWEFDTRIINRNIDLYSSPAVANGLLYIGSSDRYIFCFGADESREMIGNR
ncbi:PQQ-binding-like beta-propeller repeat protein [Candidatus Poribacteria bacterium]|nr:PQQ-binding-like beta-propeller repeat protein [Candidatus Poribacteria bacterium]MYA57131.1 PQQ-binding-like beta-propeller repeat protein [Candidatus Poribacteria bacterium]